MKRVFAYIVLNTFLIIYFISSYSPVMKKIAQFRYDWDSPLGSDNYKYGDLFGFSYLPDFKLIEKKIPPAKENSFEDKKIDFYCVCDSYLWSFPFNDSTLYNVNKYNQSRWLYDEKIITSIDTTKINFMLIEMAEWYSREFLTDSSDIFSRINVKNPNPSFVDTSAKNTIQNSFSFIKIIDKVFANKWLNRNLEFNLFDYSFLTPLKELKAQFNYKIFDKVNSEVEFSSNKEFLLYKPTIDTASNQSSFKYLGDAEVNNMVDRLNKINDYYIKRGFDYVYFSIIPKPVSIIDPNLMKYNQLITRIQSNPALKIKYIDAYNILKKEPGKVYQRSDTHWNSYGFGLWVTELNNTLKKISKIN